MVISLALLALACLSNGLQHELQPSVLRSDHERDNSTNAGKDTGIRFVKNGLDGLQVSIIVDDGAGEDDAFMDLAKDHLSDLLPDDIADLTGSVDPSGSGDPSGSDHTGSAKDYTGSAKPNILLTTLDAR
ncbi:hypothetical protein AAMO2058_000488300 [Amorphochlora amoebiformis]|eukprot:1238444-Amorphochlora_amoeboformis.AAC.1